MSRNQFATDPDTMAAVIDELYATAGGRTDLLTEEVGHWIGFDETDLWTATLIGHLRELPLQMDDAIALGRQRAAPVHSAAGFTSR
jgi:hypothetical protein